MNEGWKGDDCLILFAKSERTTMENRYAISALLPGFRLLGLRGWDDFIVQDDGGRTYCVPTVPLDVQYLAPYEAPEWEASLSPDSRFAGKIKWYAQPIVFGGDPSLGANLTWVIHEQHGQLIKWWNDQYRALRKDKT
jgi:hypothetical protein